MAIGRAARVLLACDWFLKYTTGLAARARRPRLRGDRADPRPRPRVRRRAEARCATFVATLLDARAPHLAIGGRVRDLGRPPGRQACAAQSGAWGPHVVHVQDSLANDLRLASRRVRRGGVRAHRPRSDAPSRATRPRSRCRHARRLLRRRPRWSSSTPRNSPRSCAPPATSDGADRGRAARPSRRGRGATGPVARLAALLRPHLPLQGPRHPAGRDAAVWERIPAARLIVAGEGRSAEAAASGTTPGRPALDHVPRGRLAGLFGGSRLRRAALSAGEPERRRLAGSRSSGAPGDRTAVGGLPDLVIAGLGVGGGAGGPGGARRRRSSRYSATPAWRSGWARAAATAGEASWDRVGGLTLDAYRRHLL